MRDRDDIGKTNKYSKKTDNIVRSCPCFATKLHFIMYGRYIIKTFCCKTFEITEIIWRSDTEL